MKVSLRGQRERERKREKERERRGWRTAGQAAGCGQTRERGREREIMRKLERGGGGVDERLDRQPVADRRCDLQEGSSGVMHGIVKSSGAIFVTSSQRIAPKPYDEHSVYKNMSEKQQQTVATRPLT